MNKAPSLEEYLREGAAKFEYPPTPAISLAVHTRLGHNRSRKFRPVLRAGMLAIVILLAAALAVPGVRAQVLEFLRIGVVRIFPFPPTSTIPPEPTSQAPIVQIPMTATPRPILTPQPWPEHIVSMQGLAGETSLEAAREKISFPILLPKTPGDLGEPDHVFLQEDSQMVILVWLDKEDPSQVRLSLHEIGSRSILVKKYEPRVVETTQVNGHEAAWVEGPYIVELTNGEKNWRRLVEGKTLIWETDGITYRLESDLSLEQALRIAESLQ